MAPSHSQSRSVARLAVAVAPRAVVAVLATGAATALVATSGHAGVTSHSQHVTFTPERSSTAAAVTTITTLSWSVTPTGSSDQFRGLSVVNEQTAWVSGETGTVLRTIDGGDTWLDVSPPAADGMQLRDIEAFSRDSAVALSIGSGEASRVYRTSDGGRTWTETFRNQDPAAFFDCFAFAPDGSGLAMSDPVDGAFQLIRTDDRGRSWHPFTPAVMPRALDGEFGFAASGTCLVSRPGHRYWLATGGVATPRVLVTRDGGEHWSAHTVPMRGGPTSGVYSLAFKTARQGMAVGGAFDAPNDGSRAAAHTSNGGRSWEPAGELGGYRSGVAFVPGSPRTWIAVGPTGSDVTVDDGRTWTTFDHQHFDAVQCVPRACWASGTTGLVARLTH